MKLGVLASADSWYVRDLQRAAAGRIELTPISFSQVSACVASEPRVRADDGIDLRRLDALLVRSMPPGSLEQVVFRMNALHRLAASGVTVLNPPRSLEVAIDKYLALAELQAAGLPVPDTCVSQTWERALDDFHHLGRDVVVKPLFGGEGRGIIRVHDETVAWRVFKAYQQLGFVIYQQRFVQHPGFDLRILLVGEKVFGIRRSNPFDWRTNVSRGALAEPIEVDHTLRELGHRAAAAMGAPLVGIDILPDLDGKYHLLEANAVPGWRALAQALDHDVAAVVLNWIGQQVQRAQDAPGETE